MRLIGITLLLFICLGSYSQDDYIIRVNDTVFEISLDNEYKVKLNGEEIKIMLSVKDTLIYDDDLFSFNYSKNYKFSKIEIADGIEQIMLVTAEGSGILFQKYSTINPTMLNEMMLSEVTKESLNYGFDMKRSDYTRKIKSGQKLNVSKAILTYKDETNIYEVASFGKKDEGFILMTIIMNEQWSTQGKKIIEMMWDSLIIK